MLLRVTCEVPADGLAAMGSVILALSLDPRLQELAVSVDLCA